MYTGCDTVGEKEGRDFHWGELTLYFGRFGFILFFVFFVVLRSRFEGIGDRLDRGPPLCVIAAVDCFVSADNTPIAQQSRWWSVLARKVCCNQAIVDTNRNSSVRQLNRFTRGTSNRHYNSIVSPRYLPVTLTTIDAMRTSKQKTSRPRPRPTQCKQTYVHSN